MKIDKIQEKLVKDNLIADPMSNLHFSPKFSKIMGMEEKEEKSEEEKILREKRKMAENMGLSPDLVEDFHRRVLDELS